MYTAYMKKAYTYEFTKTVTGKVTVTASNSDDAEAAAYDVIETLQTDLATEEAVEVSDLTFKDSEPVVDHDPDASN